MVNQGFDARIRTYAQYINGPYIRFLNRIGLSIDFERAERSLVFDATGAGYIDCIAGYGNCNIGHNHPRVVQAVIAQLSSSKPFNLPFVSEAQARLAERLHDSTPGELSCSLIVNSGSEAVESALKLARLVTKKNGVVAARGAWHGFTLGAMSVSEPSMVNSFRPLLPDVTHVLFDDVAAVADAVTEKTGAVIVEPIQSESGVCVPAPGYLSELEAICRSRGVLLIFDEVKTGMGKSGRLFACELDGVVPDVLIAGKSLGGGVMPIGSITARKAIWSRFGYSFPMSSTSGGGNAAACAAALETLQVISDEALCENARIQGEQLLLGLRELTERHPKIFNDVVGRGLLIGIQSQDAGVALEVVKKCISEKVLLMVAFGNRSTIVIEPPLCITNSEVNRVLETLDVAARSIEK